MSNVLNVLEEFDEQFYLTQYPDIARAIERGSLKSGLEHYLRDGRNEGRQSHRHFDTHWYRTMYPCVADDIAAGLAKSSFDHYDRIGRFRGYLPFSRSSRPANGGAFLSDFGGFWTDTGNAMDVVRGKLELGKITEEQAELLQQWITKGYVILKSGIDPEILELARAEMEAVYQGSIPEMKFLCEPISKSMVKWTPELQKHPAKAVDMQWLSQPTRDLCFSKKITDFLHLIFERRVMATQCLTFWLGSSQQIHQDGAYVTYSVPLQFAASWIALEDVALDAGELIYYPGSHRFPDYKYDGQYKSLQEARRLNAEYNDSFEGADHINSLKRRAEKLGLKQEALLAKKGDVLIWHADLAHGGKTISTNRTRKSVVTHYCPKDIAPLYFERQKTTVKRNKDGSYYTTQYYSSS